MEKVKTLIVGLGNTLMQDDGAGIYCAANIKANALVTVSECDTDIFKIMTLIKDHKRVIIIDAVDAGLFPGAIICLKEEGLFKFQNLSRSSHQISMIEALKLMKMTLPEMQDMEIFFVGIQVEEMNFNKPMTKEVLISVKLLSNILS